MSSASGTALCLLSALLVVAAPSASTLLQHAEPWDVVTKAQLDAFKCDLGGMRVDESVGPKRRPRAPADYAFTPAYMSFGPAQRAMLRRATKARGYTHFPVGPIWERGYPGWSGHDYLKRPAEFVERLREIWRDGLIPVLWLMPDGPFNMRAGAPGSDRNPIDWKAVDRVLTPIYKRADFQAVTKVVVFGWEVTDNGWVNRIDQALHAVRWMRSTFPGAQTWWHAAANSGAPCTERIDGNFCEANAWRALAPYLTGHFLQDATMGGWNMDGWDDPDDPAQQRQSFVANLKYDVMRFHTSHYAPGGLKNKDGEPLHVVAGEYSAYFELNEGIPEAYARDYGNLAMAVPGVSGYCDGGR